MDWFDRKPWYAAGLAFECSACGRCCSGPEEGYVWVGADEIERIAQFLDIPAAEFRRKYTRRSGGRYTIIERPDNHDCCFLEPDGKGSKRCTIYTVRPTQCRTWPFWPSNLSSPDAWALALLRCPGINRGSVHDLDEIHRKRDMTRT